ARGCAVSCGLERRGDDGALLLRQLPGRIGVATLSASRCLALPVVLRVRSDLKKEDVGRGLLGSAHGVIVGGTRVVAHDVAGNELVILEHQRVTSRYLPKRSA